MLNALFALESGLESIRQISLQFVAENINEDHIHDHRQYLFCR